jgi:hypothetical protein
MEKLCSALLLLLCCHYYTLSGQENKPANIDTLKYLPFEKAISLLEEKNQVKFYFDSERMQRKRINSEIINLPFEQALERIEKLSGYSSVKMNKNSYILLPYESVSQNVSSQNYITIGNPLDYGKYSTALIEGKILDGKTGDPLVGAVVSNDKLKINVNTDKSGNFSMRLPVGDHELNVRYYGYEDSNSKIKVFGNGHLSLEVFEKSISLDEVVVRAEMDQNSVMRNQMSMVRIDAKTIKELPVSMGETDIIKSVTLMPGVQSVGEFGTGFNVRGGSADQNLVLMEDLPVFNPSHVFGLISIVNSDDVSNVTLLKAGIPSKYGERASSVLDIKMGGASTDKISGKGGIGLINSRLNIKVPLLKKKVVLSLGGRSSYSDWLLQRMRDIDLKNSSASFYDFNAMLTISPNASNRISLFGYLSADDFKFSTTTKYGYENLMGGARWSHIFSDKLSMNVMAGRSQYGLNVEEDIDKPYDISKVKSGIIYDCFRWNFSWNLFSRNSVDFGLNAVKYKNSPGELTPGSAQSIITSKTIQDENAVELSGYVSDNFNLTDKVNVEAGLRYTQYYLLGPYQTRNYTPGTARVTDNLSEVKDYKTDETVYSSQGVEPRLSVIYKINTISSVKASYSKMHQYMNLISNSSVMAPTDAWKLSDNNLTPLICNQFALGYYFNFTKKMLEASVEVYFKDLKNVIEYKDGAKILMNDALETDLIPAKGYNYGIEFYVNKNTGRLTGWASYTLSKSIRKTTSSFANEQIKNNNFFNSNFDRPHNFIILGNYHISRRWRFSGTFMYNSGRSVTLPELKYNFQGSQLIYYSDRNKYRLPDYHRLDVSITLDESIKLKKKWRGSWTFSIVNLYSRKNAFSSFYQKETPSLINDFRAFSLYKLYIIGRPLPTLTYNFTF